MTFGPDQRQQSNFQGKQPLLDDNLVPSFTKHVLFQTSMTPVVTTWISTLQCAVMSFFLPVLIVEAQ